MSNLQGNCKGHQFHGAVERFDVLADYVYQKYGNKVKYIADVAGGRGMLTRILNKKYNYQAEVVDPRGWTLVGVPSRKEEFNSQIAAFYDLIIGLHPDEATRSVVEAALIRPAIIIPCCNFWDRSKKLGREAMLAELSKFYDEHNIKYERVEFAFKSTKNIGLVSEPRSE